MVLVEKRIKGHTYIYDVISEGGKQKWKYVGKRLEKLPLNQIICGDWIDVMATFSSESVDLVMFSPPYWGLRDYGVDGQIGLEATVDDYIENLVEGCREIKRILKKTGSVYIVIGDSYNGKCLVGLPYRLALALIDDGWILRNDVIWYKPNHMPESVKDRLTRSYEHIFHFVKSRKYYYNLDLIREPHTSIKDLGRKRTKQENSKYFGIRPSGYLVQHPKGKNPGDVLNLTKHDIAVNRIGNFSYSDPLHVKAYNDKGKNPGDVVRLNSDAKYSSVEPRTLKGWWKVDVPRTAHPNGKNPGDIIELKGLSLEDLIDGRRPNIQHRSDVRFAYPPSDAYNELGKNPGDFWPISTRPFKGKHFAVYPIDICLRPILSSCPPDGIVLDPMCGSGTTLLCCELINHGMWSKFKIHVNDFAKKVKWNLKWIGIDINPEYCDIARKRLEPFVTQRRLTQYF